MLRNQATALIRYEHIETTVPKAKELRPFVERLITIAKRGVAAGDGNGRLLHARRLVGRELVDGEVVGKLFDTIAPRFAERPGGYTRILRLGYRRGDSAEVAQLELVGSEYDPKAEPKETKAAAARSRRPASADDSARRRIGSAARARGCRSGQQESRQGRPDQGPRRQTHDSAKGRLDAQGLGIRDWGLGISAVAHPDATHPNPQSLVPNPWFCSKSQHNSAVPAWHRPCSSIGHGATS